MLQEKADKSLSGDRNDFCTLMEGSSTEVGLKPAPLLTLYLSNAQPHTKKEIQIHPGHNIGGL
jgi:hypothetical protein